MILVFNLSKIPRSTTRQQWREMWRWKRETERVLAKELERQRDNLMLYGSTHPELAAKWADEMINPPVLLGPYQ